MKRKYFLLATCLLVGGVLAPGVSVAARSMRLESVRTGELYGPFIIRNDVQVVLGENVYRVRSADDEKLSFVSESSGTVHGPYEVTLGRIVTIGADLYTIVDINLHAPTPSESAPEVPATPPRVLLPVPARPSVTPPPRPVRDVPAAAQRAPSRAQVAPARPAVKSEAPTPERVREKAGPISSARPARERPVPRARTVRTPRGHNYLDGMGIALDLGVVERVDYNREMTGGIAVPDTAIRRNSASVALRTGRLTVKGGMVLRAEWKDAISGGGLPFFSANLDNGDGWWAAADLRNGLWQMDAWRLDWTVGGSYRQETYDFSYSAMQSAGSVVIPGTNGAPDTVAELQEVATTGTAADLTEWTLTLGMMLSKATPAWSGYVGFEAVPLSDTELDGRITTSAASYDITLERKDPFSIKAGISMKQWGIHWFSDLSLIGEESLRLGAAVVY